MSQFSSPNWLLGAARGVVTNTQYQAAEETPVGDGLVAGHEAFRVHYAFLAAQTVLKCWMLRVQFALGNTQSRTYSCEFSAVDDGLRGPSPALDWAASTGMRIF